MMSMSTSSNDCPGVADGDDEGEFDGELEGELDGELDGLGDGSVSEEGDGDELGDREGDSVTETTSEGDADEDAVDVALTDGLVLELGLGLGLELSSSVMTVSPASVFVGVGEAVGDDVGVCDGIWGSTVSPGHTNGSGARACGKSSKLDTDGFQKPGNLLKLIVMSRSSPTVMGTSINICTPQPHSAPELTRRAVTPLTINCTARRFGHTCFSYTPKRTT